ncbi:hypothetical protein BU26DRAFT_500795 [Trematosphaeria pertusa]|uniref:Uncharacterized protein n=1 Tax=Trematosphaeria pertusa TaxID=390896 RepID=A0A6A6J172_9PLEO|nr:uncharacterized protein BU26DRAFT_500795 [Trematosphaeria pertusa]KAF2255183.1 hypothetical protein BU26DRAFT_500795 [Trematosphaeria pertusa]
MKTTAILIAIPALALASLNCTIIAPSVTQRYYTTASPMQSPVRPYPLTQSCLVLSSFKIQFVNALWPGLPYCYQERGNFTAPPLAATVCPTSSASGMASKVAAPTTLGIEPPPFPSIVSLCSLGGAPPPTAAPKVWKA